MVDRGQGGWLRRLVERNASVRVAGDDLRPWTFFAAIQIGTAICVPMFALGGNMGSHARFAELVPAVVLATAVVALFAMVTGHIGMRARLPTAVLTRQTFGLLGAKALAFALVISLLGWFGIQTELLSRALVGLMKTQFDLDVPLLPVTIGSGALISTTGIIGVKALGKLAYAAVPFLLVMISIPLVVAFQRFDVVAQLGSSAVPKDAYGFGMIVSIITGGYMTSIAITPDVSRYLRTPRDVVIGAAVSHGLALPFLILLSASLSILYGTSDLVGILVAAGLAAPTLFILVLATWSSNDKNLYESALSLSALLPAYPRWLLAVAAAILGTALASVGIFGHFIQWLIILGLVTAPVASIYSVDFFLAPHRYAEAAAAEGSEPQVRPLPICAWLFGTAFGFTTLPASSGGLELWSATRVPTFDALIASGLLYALLVITTRCAANPVRGG